MIKNYLKTSLRNLRKRPFYTTVNVLGLAIGMACTILISVYILQELSYDRFHEKVDRIYRLTSYINIGESEYHGSAVSAATAGPFREEVPEVEMVVRINQRDNVTFRKDDITIKEDKVLVADSNFFQLFSFPLLKGDPAKVLQAPNSVVMTKATARKYFQDEDPLGQTILLDGKAFLVTGMMAPAPQNAHFHFDIVYSFLSDPNSKAEDWGDFNTRTYFLLQKNASIDGVNAQLTPLLKKYFGEYELFQELGYSVEMNTQALTDIHLHSHLLGEFEANGHIKYLYIFGAIALFILFIACINFMNLSTARSADRAKEVGVRKTMGSMRSTLVRQFLAESLLLSLLSMLLALGLAEILRIPFSEVAGKDIPLPLLSSWFLPAVLLLGIIVGIAAGSYPAFYLTKFRPIEVLRGRLSVGSKNVLLRNSLVVFQFVISIVLIVCTLMVYEQLQFMRNKDLGFSKESIIVVKNAQGLGQNREAFHHALMRQSEVKGVSFSDVSPVGEYDGTVFIPALENDTTYQDQNAQVLNYIQVSYDYLPTMGIQLKEGRNFSREIASDSANYAVILNEQAVKTLGFSEPIGSYVMTASEFESEIVGVVEDFHYKSLHSVVEPLVLVLSDEPSYAEIKIASDDLPQTIALLEAQWDQLADGTPFDYSFLDEDFDALFRADQRVGMIFGGFTTLAIFIACLGLLALAAFMAEQRTKEIGIRKVMGASVKSIILLLSKDFTKLVVIAFVVAVPLAYFAVQQWLNDFAYKIDIGLSAFAIAGILALLIALLTISYQAFKAAIANPVESLRNE